LTVVYLVNDDKDFEMLQLNLAKVFLLGDDSNGYVRYEIFSKEGERPDYPEKIVVYREKVLETNGDMILPT
jgi:hypothetical protein